MKKASLSLLLILLVFSSCSKQVDLLVHNAIVYTANKDFDKATAFVVKNGRFLEVGGEELVEKYKPVSVVDARGLPVYPGFIDSHCHLLELGLNQFKANLRGTKSIEEIVDRLKKHQATSGQNFIQGIGWDHNDWEIAELPDNQKLNEAFPDNPVLIERVDGHVLLANKKALDMAAVDQTKKIEGGQIIKKKGRLSGILIDNARHLLDPIIPKFNREQQIQALITAQNICFENGLTTVDQAGISKDEILLIDSLQNKDLIKLRVYAMIENKKESLDFFFDKGGIKNNYLNVNAVKVYVDGALGSRGAALKENYSDAPNHNALPIISKDSLNSIAQLVLDNSFQMNTHAIGDAANQMVLDTYNVVLSAIEDPRWRIEHAQVIAKEDISKFNPKIIPSVQPSHAVSDMEWAKQRLGDERIKGAYAYKDLLDWSGVLALGTDFPVENVSPINTFYAAVTRESIMGASQEGFQMKNALSRYETLMGMTHWAAYANFEDKEKGSIEAGKFADFVFLDRDIMTIDIEELPLTRVVATILNGKIVFSNRL